MASIELRSEGVVVHTYFLLYLKNLGRFRPVLKVFKKIRFSVHREFLTDDQIVLSYMRQATTENKVIAM